MGSNNGELQDLSNRFVDKETACGMEVSTEKSKITTSCATGCGARSTSLWAHRNLFWQLYRDRNLHCLGMSHAMTASPNPSFRAPWGVGNAVVGRGNAGWTTLKSGHPLPCQNCSQQSPAGKTGIGSLLNHPSCPPQWPYQLRDWTELDKNLKKTIWSLRFWHMWPWNKVKVIKPVWISRPLARL